MCGIRCRHLSTPEKGARHAPLVITPSRSFPIPRNRLLRRLCRRHRRERGYGHVHVWRLGDVVRNLRRYLPRDLHAALDAVKSKLHGSIKITYSGQSETTTVTGKLNGTAISFGAVGPVGVISYTGSVSGSSMSGHYTTPKGGGTWSAHKSS